jgi:hypothetical protein
MKMEQTEYSETTAYKIQTPGKYQEESIQHSEHARSLKSRIALPDFVDTFQFGKKCITIDTSHENLCFCVGVLSSVTCIKETCTLHL